MAFEKKKAPVIESVQAPPEPDRGPGVDRADCVRISDPGIVWRAPNSTLQDKALPAIVLRVGGRRTLNLHVITDSGARVERGVRHWADPDFANPDVDTTQISSWSFNNE